MQNIKYQSDNVNRILIVFYKYLYYLSFITEILNTVYYC